MRTRERTVELRLVELAKRHGGWAAKWACSGTAGVPDRIVFLPGGRIYFVEVKRPGGKARPAQLAIHRRLEKRGQKVYVVDDADAFFREIDGAKS
jgi:hypothetical protein